VNRPAATALEDPLTPRTGIAPGAWGLLAVLTLLNVLNFVDRQLIAALAPLLIADLGLSRAEIGLLAGFGFVFFYSFVGLFLGIAADRWRRMPLVAAGVALWSATTALSGLARGFLGLALPRLFVGVGEATLTPAALAMLDDVFPRRRLALATGIYYAAIPLGAAAGLAASGFVAPRWGWRACFLVLGLAGLAAAALLPLRREPPRRGGARLARPSVRALAADLARALGRRPELALVLLGGALLCYGAASALHVVTWLVQERGFGYARAAYAAAVVAVAAGLAGNYAGGAFGDWCGRPRAHGHLFSLVPMTAFFAPASALFYLAAPDTPLFWLLWFVAAAGTSAWFGPLFAAIQELSPTHTRSSTVAVALLVLNLLGVGPGPLVTGLIGDQRSLTAGLLSSLVVVALALVPFGLALRRARRAPSPRDVPATLDA
jgi:MFS family permease